MKTAEYYVVDVTEHVNEKVSEHFTISEFKCTDNSRVVVLNKALIDVLETIRKHFNKPVTLATLLDEVWGYDSDEDVRMLRVHVGGLRNKIEPDTKHPKYLHTVTNVGYKLTPFGEE